MKTAIARAALLAAFVGASLGLLAGCTVARKQETVGQYIDGSAITTEVKARLADDPATSAMAIHVATIDGGVVQLSGFAKSQAEKDRAGEIARAVKGVAEVRNDLVVRR